MILNLLYRIDLIYIWLIFSNKNIIQLFSWSYYLFAPIWDLANNCLRVFVAAVVGSDEFDADFVNGIDAAGSKFVAAAAVAVFDCIEYWTYDYYFYYYYYYYYYYY